MTAYRHDFGSLAGDYTVAAAGLALTAGPLALLPVVPAVAWGLGIAAAGFALHGLRTAFQHASPLELTPDGLSRGGPLPRRILWDRLDGIRLRYFSTRRDGARGWMQLTLKENGNRIRIESTLPGFDDIVRRAVRAAAIPGLEAGTRDARQSRKARNTLTTGIAISAPDAGFVER
jgi:hypothetical protein